MLLKSVILAFAFAALFTVGLQASADTVAVPVHGNQVPVASVGDVSTTPTSRNGDATVANPDQTFQGSIDGASLSAGTANGVPNESGSVDPAGAQQVMDANANPGTDLQNDVQRGEAIAGKKRLLLAGRKMLGELELSGDGVSAGNNEAGAAANAYGHGDLGGDVLNPTDTHIEPHGVDSTVTANGEDTSGSAGVNPDCVGTAEGYNEGPDCVAVNGK